MQAIGTTNSWVCCHSVPSAASSNTFYSLPNPATKYEPDTDHYHPTKHLQLHSNTSE